MISIQEILSRIKRDREFGRGNFEIGYYDRVRKEILRVPMSEVILPADDRACAGIMGEDGIIRTLQRHRIRQVFKDNKLIRGRPGFP